MQSAVLEAESSSFLITPLGLGLSGLYNINLNFLDGSYEFPLSILWSFDPYLLKHLSINIIQLRHNIFTHNPHRARSQPTTISRQSV